jgi:hypothetical protein
LAGVWTAKLRAAGLSLYISPLIEIQATYIGRFSLLGFERRLIEKFDRRYPGSGWKAKAISYFLAD